MRDGVIRYVEVILHRVFAFNDLPLRLHGNVISNRPSFAAFQLRVRSDSVFQDIPAKEFIIFTRGRFRQDVSCVESHLLPFYRRATVCVVRNLIVICNGRCGIYNQIRKRDVFYRLIPRHRIAFLRKLCRYFREDDTIHRFHRKCDWLCKEHTRHGMVEGNRVFDCNAFRCIDRRVGCICRCRCRYFAPTAKRITIAISFFRRTILRSNHRRAFFVRFFADYRAVFVYERNRIFLNRRGRIVRRRSIGCTFVRSALVRSTLVRSTLVRSALVRSTFVGCRIRRSRRRGRTIIRLIAARSQRARAGNCHNTAKQPCDPVLFAHILSPYLLHLSKRGGANGSFESFAPSHLVF